MSATLPFLEKLLQVLSQGGFSATYKYAVLLALIDLCLEKGYPPDSVTTVELARRVVELYWPQTRGFPRSGDRALRRADELVVLRQNSGKHATITALIRDYQDTHADELSPPEPKLSPAAKALYEEVEWVLVTYPLPRLQRVGGEIEAFLYQITWDEGVSRRLFNAYKRNDAPLFQEQGFDNQIRFVYGASEALVALSSVLRPLIQQHWLARVRRFNDLPEAYLEEFMFGADRARLNKLRAPLRDLQAGGCFYCKGALDPKPQVDHFMPWARYPDDGLDNLVLAHATCNRDKLHYLADLDFAQRWAERRQRPELDEIARDLSWPRDSKRTFNVVAGVYQGVPEGVRLWGGLKALRRVSTDDLPRVHDFGRRLLSEAAPPHGGPAPG